MPFTQEELAAMRAADEEIERTFSITKEERNQSNARDKAAMDGRTDTRSRSEKQRDRSRDYYEIHREEKIAKSLSYYYKNRDAILARKKARRAGRHDKNV